MNLQELLGMILGPASVLTGITAIFKLREGRLAKKLEIESFGQKILVERLQSLETRDMIREKRVEDLTLQMASLRHDHSKLQWEYDELKKDHNELRQKSQSDEKLLSALKGENERLYNEIHGKSVPYLRKRPPRDP